MYSKESTTKLLESINEVLQDCKIEGQYTIVFPYTRKIFYFIFLIETKVIFLLERKKKPYRKIF